MATATLAWDNTAVLASGNATGQVASKRIKAVGGAFSTSGFSPANPLLTSAITTDATITPNRIYEFKVEATCVLGGPTINNNGLKEQIVFECLALAISGVSDTDVTVNVNLVNIDFTKVKYTIRKVSDDSLVATATVAKSGDAAFHTFTGLTGATDYYIEVEYYTDIETVEKISSAAAYLNAVCGGDISGFKFTTEAAPATDYNVAIWGKMESSILSGGVVIQWSITNNGIDWANVGPAFASTTCQLRGTIAAIPAGSTLYLQIIAGPSNPVKFGDINGSSCPISSTGCLTSFLVNSNLSRAFTIKVLSSAVVSC